MCNILKNDELVIEYTYITEITHVDSHNIFYIPSFISPRYKGDFIPNSNHSICSKIKIHDKSNSVRCSMPDTLISFEDNLTEIKYLSQKPLDKDIEVSYNSEFQQKAFIFNTNGYTMAMAEFIPVNNKHDTNTKQDLIFILDCSGSMDGDRINNSRKAIIHCLKKMENNQNYRFNIICFGSTVETYLSHMIDTTKENIDKAIKYCENIRANLGGTEIFNAIAVALSMSTTAILMTDGDTTNNSQLQNLCARSNCLSILGIGSGINRANIKDMTTKGSGMALFSQTETNIVSNTDSIFDSITKPSIKNPSINWSDDKSNLVVPNNIIFDQVNTIYATLSDPTINIFELKDLNLVLNLDSSYNQIDPKYLGAIIAKRIIQKNTVGESITKEQVVSLATSFNIITQYTSMVAVSSLENSPQIDAHQDYSNTGYQEKLYTQILSYQNCGPRYISSVNNMVDTMKTTIRETTCVSPYDTMRTTMKETTCVSPYDTMRTTMKETTCAIPKQQFYNINLPGPTNEHTKLSKNYGKHSEETKCCSDEDDQDEDMGSMFGGSSDDESDFSSDSIITKKSVDIATYTKLCESGQKCLNRNQFTKNIFKYFDTNTNLFKLEVSNILTKIPQELLSDPYGLTLFIFYCLKDVTKLKTLYNKYLSLAKKNDNMLPLFSALNL